MKMLKLHNGMTTMLDNADFKRASRFHWTAVKKKTGYYAMRMVELPKIGNKRRNKKIYLHRWLVGEPIGKDVHHKNRNPLDNRRRNLQILGKTEHRWLASKTKRRTSSKFIGVSFFKSNQKYAAQLVRNGKRIFFGLFESPVTAHRMRQSALQQYGA